MSGSPPAAAAAAADIVDHPDDGDMEDEEPRLHYHRLSDVNTNLGADSASCVAVNDKLLVRLVFLCLCVASVWRMDSRVPHCLGDWNKVWNGFLCRCVWNRDQTVYSPPHWHGERHQHGFEWRAHCQLFR
jgi:hypothetical protein